MQKKIAIVGSSGLLGSAVKEHLLKYKFVDIPGKSLYESPGLIARKLEGVDIIINLAGHSINGRWTNKRKELIYKSRIELTSNLVKAISFMENKPDHLINASAVGIYDDGDLSDESSTNYAHNVLAKLVIDWEKAADKVNELNVGLSIVRLGVVLSRDGGAYKLLRGIFKLGLGGKIGTGKQGMSFILIEDFINAMELIIEKKLLGIINMVCPEPVDNETFIKEIAGKLNRPAIFTVPEFIVNTVFGEGSVIFLKGQKVYPDVLLKYNFHFIGHNLKACLDILEK